VQLNPEKQKVNVLKKFHNLSSSGGSAWGGRLHTAPVCGEISISGYKSRLKLRLRESQSIFAEFMDFFSMLTFSLM